MRGARRGGAGCFRYRRGVYFREVGGIKGVETLSLTHGHIKNRAPRAAPAAAGTHTTIDMAGRRRVETGLGTSGVAVGSSGP